VSGNECCQRGHVTEKGQPGEFGRPVTGAFFET